MFYRKSVSKHVLPNPITRRATLLFLFLSVVFFLSAAGAYAMERQISKTTGTTISVPTYYAGDVLVITGDALVAGDWTVLKDLRQNYGLKLANGQAAIPDDALYACKTILSFDAPDVATVGEDAFVSCSNLLSVSLPQATELKTRAFDTCNGLISVFLPQAKTIGQFAFRNCSKLATISLPQAEQFSTNAFNTHKALRLMELGAKLPTIGVRAFLSVPALLLLVPDTENYDPLPSGAKGFPDNSKAVGAEITRGPLYLLSGDTLNLSTVIDGASGDRQWKKDGVALSGATAATYTKTGMQPSDGGNYSMAFKHDIVQAGALYEIAPIRVEVSDEQAVLSVTPEAIRIMTGTSVDMPISVVLTSPNWLAIDSLSPDSNMALADAGLTVTSDDVGLRLSGTALQAGTYTASATIRFDGSDGTRTVAVPVIVSDEQDIVDDVTITPEPGGTDPDDIAEGDEVDITYNFGSDIPGVVVEFVNAAGAAGWDLSGLTVVPNGDGTITISGTAKTPGNYVIDVGLLVDGMPINVQLLLTIQEARRKGGDGSSGCAAAGFGLFALLPLTMIYRRKK